MTFDGLRRLTLTYFYFSSQQYLSSVITYNVTLNVKKNSANSPVRTHSLQNKHARVFLRGFYSDRFQ